MNEMIFSVLKSISSWNLIIKRPKDKWSVCPEFCYYTNLQTKETTFIKEVMDFVKSNGVKDRTQTAEEFGAFGQLYTIDSKILLVHFGCELVKK